MPLPARRAYPLALLLGGLAACGFAPIEAWPLTLGGLGGLIAVLGEMPTLRRAAALGWWFGLGHFTVGNNWIATAFTYQAAMPAWLGWIAVVVLALYLAVFPALATAAAWWLARYSAGPEGAATIGFRELLLMPLRAASLWNSGDGSMPRLSLYSRLPFFLGATWIFGEYLRATLFTGFAWNPLAAIWVPLWPLAGIVAYVGTYGLSGLTVLAAGGIFAAIRALRRSLAAAPAEQRRTRAIIVGGMAIAIGIGLASVIVPLATLRPRENGGGLRLRIVQPNVNQAEKWSPDFQARNYARLVALTGPATAEPRLILWPEVAVPNFLEEEPGTRLRIARLLGPRDLLLTGGIALRYDAQGETVAATNSVFGLDPRGRLVGGRYDKSHLVPYGEYLPMRPILSRLGLSRLAPGDMDFDPGPGARDLVLPGFGQVGVQICYEIIFSARVIDAAHRPRFLFNPSNDAWFGRWGPPQHLAQARLRAMEEAIPVIRATPTGISAVIDTHGQLLHALPWRTAGAIDARLPAEAPPTLFARFGNVLPLALALLLGLIGFASRRQAR